MTFSVLHLVSDLGQGGAQRYTCDLIKQQIASGDMEVEIAAVFYKGALWENLEALPITMSCLGVKNAIDIPGLLRLYRFMRSRKFDVIHVHHIHPAISVFLWSLPSAHIYTEHGGGLLGGGWKERIVYNFFHGNYCRFIAISAEMKKFMSTIKPNIERKITVVHNGVDIDSIDAVPVYVDSVGDPIFSPGGSYIGIIGRLEPQKGIHHFIEVAKMVIEKKPNTIFLIIGEGSLYGKLSDLVKAYGLENKVRFLGYRVDAISILKRLEVFLFTSDYEPFGLVITEAMACRVPVVAMHLRGAVPEIIDDGVNGYVVMGKDYNAMSDRVLGLLDDQRQSEAMVLSARKKVERMFTMYTNAQQIKEIYKECVSSKIK